MQITQSDFSAGKELFCRRTEWHGKEKQQRLPEKMKRFALVYGVAFLACQQYDTALKYIAKLLAAVRVHRKGQSHICAIG